MTKLCAFSGVKSCITVSYSVSRICLFDNNMKTIKAKLAKP